MNLNRVLLIGRLTRDPEIKTFSSGGRVAQIGFAVNNRKKDQTTGQWADDPCFLDAKAWNRDNGRKLADFVEQHFTKGSAAFIDGHLVLETWEDKNGGGRRSKLVVMVDDIQFAESKSASAQRTPFQQQPERRQEDEENIPF